MQRRIWKGVRFIHAWGGMVLGLLLLLSSVTGTLLIWKQDYVKLTIPAAQVDYVPTPANLAAIAQAVESHFDNNEILQIQFPTAAFPLARVTLADTDYAYFDTAGNLVTRWHQNERLEEWLYDLHHRLLLEELGLTLVGLAAIALFILVLAGLVTFVPLRRTFRQGVVPQNLSRGQLVTSHRNLGAVLALPLLLTLITGVTLAFPARIESMLLEEIRFSQEYSDMLAEGTDAINGDSAGDWLPALQRSLDTFGGGQIRTAQLPNDFYVYRVIGIQQPGTWNPLGLSRAYIDAEAGYMDVRIDEKRLPLIEKAYNSAYPLHTAKTGSLLYKLFMTLCGLAVAVLVSMGMMSFIKARMKKPVSDAY